MAQVSRATHASSVSTKLADNTAGDISAQDVREVITDLEDSVTWYDEAEIVNDTTPQLGGNLDVNGNKIVSTSNGDIDIEPNGTGNVILGNFVINADATIGASQDNYVLTYDHSAGTWGPEAASGGGGGGYTQEDIEDFAAAMLTGGSHTLISFAYSDASGVVNATVTDDLSQYDNTTSQFITAASAPVASVAGKTGAVVLAAGDIASGTFADARVAASNVTQHQASLSVGAGQITGTFGTSSIADEAVTVAKMQHIATDSFLGRDTAGTGDVEVLSAATALSVLGLSNALKSDTTATLTVGYTSTDYNGGTQSSGTYTPSAANSSTQYIVNGGAFTLAPPTASTSIVLHITNNGSAGTITTSGFTKVTGDSFTTTDTHEFMCVITRCNSKSVLNVTALQ